MRNRLVLSSGIFLRVIVYLLASRGFATDYFYPFVGSLSVSADPWSDWLRSNGRVDAFPYGLILFIIVKFVYQLETLAVLILPFLPEGTAFVLLLLMIDLLIYFRIKRKEGISTASIYFLSPIAIYVSFFYLQTDVIVGILLLLCAISLADLKVKKSGFFLGCAIGCKYGALIVIPFMLAFALVNVRFRASILRVFMYAIPIACLSYIPALWSASFRKMVLQTSEASQVYAMGLKLGDVTFFVFPGIYLLLLIWIWRSGRSNLKVLTGFIGTALFSLSLTSTATVGWHLWGLSLLILLSHWQKKEIYVAFFILQLLVVARDIASGNLTRFGLNLDNQHIENLSFTLSAILGFSWALSNLAKIVGKSDKLKLNRKPLFVAIAGNSGVGKDTFAASISKAFGEKNVTFLSGDGYHKYERGNGRWRTKSHLNPTQNRLVDWKIDIQNAISRRPILKSEYDHSIGRFTPKFLVKPKDFVVSQGLHALDSEISKHADLKVFMEMDDKTRMRLKILRDTSKRGRSVQSIKSEVDLRRHDYEHYVLPQREIADIVVEQQIKVWSEELEISNVKIEVKDLIFSDYLESYFLPHVQNMQILVKPNHVSEFRFNTVNLVSSETVYLILEKNLESFSELSIKREQVHSGALGIITAVSLFFLEYRRKEVEE